jgi:uncharacterized protein
MKNGINLVSGGYFCFDTPENSLFTVEDVALNLSHINRFTGSSEQPYSVCQHSIYVSLLFEDKTLALQGLMHDAVEAFLGDVSQPLKRLLPDYRKIELECEAAICKKYGIDFPFDPRVKDSDNSVFVAERRDLQPKAPQGLVYNGKVVQPAPFKIVPWSAEKSRKEFLKRFKELGGEWK